MNRTFLTVGKIVFALPFLFFAMGHLSNANQMVGMVPSYFPAKVFLVQLSCLGMGLAGILIILSSFIPSLGKLTMIASVLLAALCVLFGVTIHAVNIKDVLGNTNMMEMVAFV
jgi:hypothetical protein